MHCLLSCTSVQKQLTQHNSGRTYCRLFLKDNSFQGWNAILQDVVYVLNKWPKYGTVSLTARMRGSENQKVGVTLSLLYLS